MEGDAGQLPSFPRGRHQNMLDGRSGHRVVFAGYTRTHLLVRPRHARDARRLGSRFSRRRQGDPVIDCGVVAIRNAHATNIAAGSHMGFREMSHQPPIDLTRTSHKPHPSALSGEFALEARSRPHPARLQDAHAKPQPGGRSPPCTATGCARKTLNRGKAPPCTKRRPKCHESALVNGRPPRIRPCEWQNAAKMPS